MRLPIYKVIYRVMFDLFGSGPTSSWKDSNMGLYLNKSPIKKECSLQVFSFFSLKKLSNYTNISTTHTNLIYSIVWNNYILSPLRILYHISNQSPLRQTPPCSLFLSLSLQGYTDECIIAFFMLDTFWKYRYKRRDE